MLQFEKHDANKVYAYSQGLPTPDGYENDYIYYPRYPDAKIPLIEPQRFARYLRACNEDCMWSLICGKRLHDCFFVPPRDYVLSRIPKKKSEFRVDSYEGAISYAWGIEADYALSFLHLCIYHLIPLLSGFIFWVYWLATHSEDWQNASVPTLTTVACMAVFWVPFGFTYNSHLRA